MTESIQSKKLIPGRNRFQVPADHWRDLLRRDMSSLCLTSLAEARPPDALVLRFLNTELLVDLSKQRICRCENGLWKSTGDPLLDLLVIVYTLRAGNVSPADDWIGPGELKYAHFFRGPHALRTDPLEKRYGRDLKGFNAAAETLGGHRLSLADAAWRLFPFPRIPLCFLLWEGDEEFGPRVSVLFDRTIESHLPADAIWALVNRVSEALLAGRVFP